MKRLARKRLRTNREMMVTRSKCFAWCAGFLALGVSALAVHADENAKNGLNPLEMQKARVKSVTSKGDKVWYTTKFDLSGLPEYKPDAKITGTIHQWGNNYIGDGPLAQMWEDGFKKYHPDVTFEDNFTSSVNGFPGLITGKADIAQMGREVLWDELQGYQRQFAAEPIELTIATGSYNIPGWTFALGIFVNKDNPLKQITFEQLDGVFGAQRTGGWKGLEWDPSVARGPEKNIRTWGQLGVTGDWADKPIHIYGYTAQFHFPDEFAKKVFGGGTKWNETIKEYVNAAKPDGNLALAGDLFMADLSKDPYGIAFTGIPHATPQTKSLAVSLKPGGPFVPLTLDTVQNRTYPLTRDIYAYVHPGKLLEPKVREFMRYILSREGQEAVMKDGKYLPLTAEAAKAQLEKLK
jgi:phosphate transport system substrate-binding protein